jgi:hypothetical protein
MVLRRTVFLGLTLPEIAAAGVAFTFWSQQLGLLPQIGRSRACSQAAWAANELLSHRIFGAPLGHGSVRLDLPLGPTDVTLGCILIFLAYGWRRISPKTFAMLIIFCFFVSLSACASQAPGPPVPEATAVPADQLWLAKVKNSTAPPLFLPSNNPLRSRAEMAGKLSPREYRQSLWI